jgi:hypothetical protein
MIFKSLLVKNEARRFSFTPYYYDPLKDAEAEQETEIKPRIQFRRLRRRPVTSGKSIRLKIFLAFILLFFLFYFNGMVREEKSKFEVESIRIEMSD